MKGKAEGEVERKREKGSRRGWRERNTQTEPTREKEKGIGEPGCQQEADQDRKRTAKGTEKTHVEVLGERCHHSPLCLSAPPCTRSAALTQCVYTSGQDPGWGWHVLECAHLAEPR
jgi:hypothetical protein